MKRETLRHPKTYDLAARLGCSRPEALGYLTLLWDYTAEVATQGDIGKWPDGAIARACDWLGDPTEFVQAMVDAKWLDRSDGKHRLVVHDWHDHCERWVKLKLDKLGLTFVVSTVEGSTERSIEASTEGSTERSPPRDRTEPNRTKPNLPGPGPGIEPGPDEFGGVVEEIPALAEAVNRTVDPLPANSLNSSVFAPLTWKHLRSTKSMVEWHARQLSAVDPACGGTEADLLLVLAAAIYVMEIPSDDIERNRVAVFIGIVRKKAWKRVVRYIDQARKRFDEFQKNGVAVE